MDNYILKDRAPVRCDDILTWARFVGDIGNRRVKETQMGDVRVSTVFLGTDHNWMNEGEPILFETMVFGQDDEMMERCSTWEEAEAQHDRVVKRLQVGQDVSPSHVVEASF